MATAQTNILELFEKKRPYFALLDKLYASETPFADAPLSKQITIAYDMVILELKYLSNNQSYCQIRYWNDKLYDVYFSQKAKTTIPETLSPDSKDFKTPAYWNDATIKQQLTIVEDIAAAGAHCGHDFYSEILVTESSIKVSQINWRNAKSIDHKNNYSMWSLEFLVPMPNVKNVVEDNISYDEYKIGTLIVSFSDRSKPQSSCKETVLEKIKALAEKNK